MRNVVFKMRFSLKQLMLGVSLCALGVFCMLMVYRNVIVPRTPIAWHSSTLDDLEQANSKTNRIVIVAANWTITGSFADIRARLEDSQLRKLVARHSIECWQCDVTDHTEFPIGVMGKQKIDRINPPFVIILRGNTFVVCPISNNIDLQEVRQCIAKTFAANEETR
jgi:hypothetical protein